MRPLSIVIPNWNGINLLRPCLDSVAHALRFAGYPEPWEIVVADDGSTDGGVAMLREAYPAVQVVQTPTRGGFISNANRGIRQVTNPHFALLNNDVTVDEEFFAHWEKAFDDPTVFSVTSRIMRPDGITFDSGRRVGVWDRGLIRHWVVCDVGTTSPTLYACGGASFYASDRFRCLGGFDELFRPMYAEDFDVSYRAWKRGWSTIYEPSCVARHDGSVSAKQVYQTRELNLIIAKNHYLFIWKNITDKTLVRQHLQWLPFWLAQGWRSTRRLVSAGFILAVAQMWEALRRRRIERLQERVSDLEIWNRFAPTSEDLRHSPYRGYPGTS